MSGILRLESLTKGNTLKQGDLTLLKYRLFDVDGEKLNIAGKSAKVRLMKGSFTFIAYEKEGLTVAPDDTISFSVNKILPSGLYHLEVIVDGKYIFPSREDEGGFNVDKSTLGADINIVEATGVEAVARKAASMMKQDEEFIDGMIANVISDTNVGNIEEYYNQFNEATTEFESLKTQALNSVTKSDKAIADSASAKSIAQGIDAKATSALSLSESADTLSKSVQDQFNQVVIDGDSSVESAQARVTADGMTKATLKERLDDEHTEVTTQLAQTANGIKPSHSVWTEFEHRSVNVEWFGAKGDGITDDTLSFKRAVDFIKSSGGGVLTVPKSRYYLSGGVLLSGLDGVTINGNYSTFEISSSVLFQVTQSKNIVIDGVTLINTTDSVKTLFTGSEVEDIIVKNCSTDRAGLAELIADEEAGEFQNERIKFHNCHADGGFVSGNIVTIVSSKHIHIDRCVLKNTEFDCVKTGGGGSEDYSEYITVTNCEISYARDDGIDMYSGGRYLVIEDNHIHHCKFALSLKTQGVIGGSAVYTNIYNVKVNRNRITNCERVAQLLTCRDVLFTYNHVEYNGTIGSGNSDHIIAVSGDFQDVRIEGNVFRGNEPNVNVISFTGSLSSDKPEPTKCFTISENYFVGNKGRQINLSNDWVGTEGETFILMGSVKGNNVRNNDERFIGGRLTESHIIITNNQVADNINGIMLNGVTENTSLVVIGNQIFNLKSGYVFSGAVGADVKQSNNSWNV